MIYHITSQTDLKSARQKGEYTAPSLESEGFIHCSTEQQVIHVANAFYRGRNDLVLLKLDESRIKPKVKWEAPSGPLAPGHSESDSFPHVYGPINLDAIASVVDFQPDPDGMWHSLPV